MNKRYREMTIHELEREMERLSEEMKRAELQNMADIAERKYYTAKAYTLSKEDFPPGLYHAAGHDEPFRLDFLNGVMAWGKIGDEEDVSFLISMLEKL